MDLYTPNPANDPQTLLVPDDVTDEWTASVINAPTESLGDSVAYLRQRSWLASANWPHGLALWSGAQVANIPGGSFTFQVPPVWDAAYGRWLAGGLAGSIGAVIQSPDGFNWQVSFQFAGSGVTRTSGVLTRAIDGVSIMFVDDAGTWKSIVFVPSTNALTSGAVAWLVDPGAGHWHSGVFFSAIWVAWQGGSSTVSPHWSADGITWSAPTTWAPPSGFTIHDRAHLVATQGGSSVICIFPSGTSVVASFMVSTDGKTWVTAAMPTLGAGESVIDAAFDSFTGKIYLLTGTSSVTHLWTTPVSGTFPSWTLVSTVNHQCFALRANGRELMIWTQIHSAFVSSSYVPVYRGLVSVDAGATWRWLGIATNTAPGNYFALKANGAQFLYLNTTEYAASLAAPLGPILGV